MYTIEVYDGSGFCILTTSIPMLPRIGEEIEFEDGTRYVINGIVYPLKRGHNPDRVVKFEVERLYP